jgi:2-oxoglutarate/2-oxoacid ferredoxin oxidoreductase subunit beta
MNDQHKIFNQTVEKSVIPLSKEDFVSDQMVRWCPGCGSHAILNSVEQVFPKIGYKKENFMIVSGIGCSSRFPYYVNTYGIHGIHGRASAIATGVKLANPHLSVWIATGDGDSMAIGGNHFIHIIRRNVDLNIMLFNNQIYGLTKGQYSPTSDLGAVTKTSPQGTIENPFIPGQLALGAGGTFFARAVDNNIKQSQEIFELAAKHEGTSLVEILQNCVIFNDGVHAEISDPKMREERQIYLKHGEPMIFGNLKDKGLIFDKTALKVVTIGENGITRDDILIHDVTEPFGYLHQQLIGMKLPDFPVAMGVIRAVAAPVYDQMMEKQITDVKRKAKIRSVDELLNSGNIWVVD